MNGNQDTVHEKPGKGENAVKIHIDHLSKSFGDAAILHDIDIEIKSGELIALLGPSGSGKTSLLRIIAGLEYPDRGRILFNEEDYTERHARERKLGFVFQHYALFRNMTIFENIAYGLKVRPRKLRPKKDVINQKVHELLSLIKLNNYANHYPAQLSGGQRQRVALARSLAVEPAVLLLDEPFGALDAKVRKELRRWLRNLHNEYQITSVFVTHDQEEALEVADRIVIMNEGRIEQIGTPLEVYENPASAFVLDFLGSVNTIQGRVKQGKLETGNYKIELPEYQSLDDIDGIGYVRPHDLDIDKDRVSENSIESIVQHIHPVGSVVRVELSRKDNGQLIEAEIPKNVFRTLSFEIGEKVYVTPKSVKMFLDYSI